MGEEDFGNYDGKKIKDGWERRTNKELYEHLMSQIYMK